jgi:large subunit ribosomal protein L13
MASALAREDLWLELRYWLVTIVVVMSTDFVSTEAAREGSKWWVIDAAGIPVGRLATEAAHIIRGKHKPTYTPNVDGGDFVVVINADKVVLTGNKGEGKMYRHVTGYIGGLKEIPAKEVLADNPERAIESAVAGMLPEGILGHRLKSKLKVYRGSQHPHSAQTPAPYAVKYVKNK